MITTKVLSLEEANPKPVRGVNYAGQPMSDDEYYNGRPEHQDPTLVRSTSIDTPVTRVKRGSKVSAWTAEKRAAYSARMREWHARRKADPNANTGAI